MFSRRAAFITLVVIMALTSAWGFGGATRASAQAESGFVEVTTDCFVSTFTMYTSVDGDFFIQAVDGEGTLLGGYGFFLTSASTYSNELWYDSVPVNSVTITLYWSEIAGGPVLDTVTFAVDCFEAEPGCDVGMVPEGSVVGQVNWDAETYWTPGQLVSPPTTLPTGKTAWVLGLDLTREYYKIVWSCTYLWVKMGTMGPNPDALWQGTPLPMRTVK